MVREELGKGGKIGGGGIAFDATQGFERVDAGGESQADFEEIGSLCECKGEGGGFVAVIAGSAKENGTGVRNFCGDDVGGDGEGGRGVVGGAVLGPAEKDVAGGEAVCGGHEFAVGSVEGKGDIGLGATRHKRSAGGGVVSEADDAIEIVQGNAEFRLAFVANLNGFAVLSEIGIFKRDEEGIEVSFHVATGDSSCRASQVLTDFLARGWQMLAREQAAHFLDS